ncbi:hypothetical protein [Streptomyces iconiensis]|uniref:Hydrogenase expression protein HypF n=1 Tax=Streptomyces iconiensis TaxID=1384038 RepID=A0ABT7ACR3_9ACTN|nr:hypothetical protein [Streptomyces iconiensis]MDJ1138403.1 hypothetical protein [Streptomyces iconiensis]
MPGDEVHEEAGASADSAPHTRGRTGPRHAAPRKPLLTRFHVPAGKAVALAAMPSAVLMGMGLTPQLANAKPLPKNPFKGDACVSAPDKEETEAEKQDRKDRAEKLKRDLEREQAKREKAAKAAGEGPGDNGDKKPGSGDSGDAADKSLPGSPAKPSGGSGGSGGDDAAGKPSSPPAASKPGGETGDDSGEKNPWYDPLGVGKKIDDAFKPKDEKGEPAGEKSEKPAPSPSSGSGSGSADADEDADKPSAPREKPAAPGGNDRADARADKGDPGSGTAGKDSSAAKEKAAQEKLAEKAKEKAKAEKAAKDAKKSEDEPGVSKKDGTARDYDAAKDAGKPFPCPEKTDVDGTDEQTPAQVPNQPWNLEASSLTLKGLDYEGVVNITMPNGKTKQALKFTADTLDIGDLHQTVKGPNGTTYHVQAAEGSTSTIRGGKVTMYTEELKGNLFGLIPITFSPETPPPINVPFAYFTKVNVKQAGQFGGNLTVPGLHQWVK